MYRIPVATLLLLAILSPSGSPAHHAIVGFDRERTFEVEGVVELVFWRNPHTRFDVRTADGELWILEGPSVNAMLRETGARKEEFEVGATVSFTGFPALSGEPRLQAIMARVSSGEDVVLWRTHVERLGLVEVNEQITPDEALASAARASANGIFRVWSRPLTGPGRTATRPSDAPLPLTDAAIELHAAWDPYDNPLLRCEPPGLPEAMVTPYPIEIIDNGDDTLTIRMEEWDNVRTIHMRETASEPSRLGHSVGRFEGDDLVVHTTNISYAYFSDRGEPQSSGSEIIERFEMNDDQTRLDWSATYTDPLYMTEPVTLPIVHFEWQPGNMIHPYECTVAPK